MVIILVKIISKAVYPAGLSFILALAGFALKRAEADRKKRWGNRLMVLGLLIFYIFGNGWVSEKLGRSLEWRVKSPDPMERADGVIVLGGSIAAKVKPRKTAELSDAGDRVVYGAYLMQEDMADWILCSGGDAGVGNSIQKEADSMKEILLRFEIAEEVILIERQSRNTIENAIYSLQIASEKGAESVYLVTSASHMPRSLAIFQKQALKMGLDQLKIFPAPCDYSQVEPEVNPPWYYQLANFILPDARALENSTKYIHEYYGIIYYKLRGWI